MDGSDLFVARAAHVLSRGLPLELLIHAFNWSFPFTQSFGETNLAEEGQSKHHLRPLSQRQ